MKALVATLGAITGLAFGIISLPFDVLELAKDQFFAPDRRAILSFLWPMNWLRFVGGSLWICLRNIIICPIVGARSLMGAASIEDAIESFSKSANSMPAMLVSYPKQQLIADEATLVSRAKAVGAVNPENTIYPPRLVASNNVIAPFTESKAAAFGTGPFDMS